MARIKRKYIDSHWLIFVVQGIIALFCGWYLMFVNSQDVTFLVIVVGVMLLAMGAVELFNLVHREKAQVTWGFTLFAAVAEVLVGLLLLLTSQGNNTWHLVIIAVYTLIRGLCELFIAFRSIDDRTDKFIWGLCGICGVVLSFVVFNSGHLATGAFIKIFASYLVILGIANLFYGVHNRDQKLEDKEARQLASKNARTQKARKKSTTRKKKTVRKK